MDFLKLQYAKDDDNTDWDTSYEVFYQRYITFSPETPPPPHNFHNAFIRKSTTLTLLQALRNGWMIPLLCTFK